MSSFNYDNSALPVDRVSADDVEFRSKLKFGNLEVSQFADGNVNYQKESGDESGGTDERGAASDDSFGEENSEGEAYSNSAGGQEEPANAEDFQYLQEAGPRIKSEVSSMGDSELIAALSQIPNKRNSVDASADGGGKGFRGGIGGSNTVVDNPEETAKALLIQRAQDRLQRSEAFQNKVAKMNRKLGLGQSMDGGH